MSAAADLTWTLQDPKPEILSLFGTAPLGLAHCEQLGHIIAMNSALEQLTGIRFDKCRSIRLPELVDADERAEMEHRLVELAKGTRDSFRMNSPAVGNRTPLQWTVWKFSGVHDSPHSVMALAYALPDDSTTGQHLRQAARLEAVGRLAGGVAHDFNNLLTGMLLYCDLAISSLDPGHRARKYTDEIRRTGMQASGLVRQLLAVARPGNSQVRLLSLNEIAEGLRNLLLRLVGGNIELKLQLDPNLGLVQMDPTQAQQILLNLVLNARDAMPHGGQIRVESRNCKLQILIDPESSGNSMLPCAVLSVEDTGDGMDAATRARLFEPFFTTKAGKGTGLGLVTVHDIVIASGGLIHVSSEPGRGTRFSIFLPLAPEPLNTASRNDFYPVNHGEVPSSNEED